MRPALTLLTTSLLGSTPEVGGTWGYDDSSVDAIRFSVDKDIVLGGAGVYADTAPAAYSLHVSLLLEAAQLFSYFKLI